jgi:hypothetical protein
MIKTVIKFLKNHYGKIFAGTTGTIVLTLGGYVFSEARYAKTPDVKALQVQVQQLEQKVKDLENSK